MPISELKLIKRCSEYLESIEYKKVQHNTRGIYVLYKKQKPDKYNVVYIGMARGLKAGIRSRFKSHLKKKALDWSHFSLYEVWDNITADEVKELEGLFRHIYRKDSKANKLNIQRGFNKIRKVRKRSLKDWAK
jgi:hypothetical protein